ncbi:MAG: hypothetical protein LC808_30220 [Actinobacteria bacterium]|nr:hypothetical protein [Actinomycetota bacterium]
MHEFKEGDRVRYTGPIDVGSGEPSLGIPDLTPGDEGWVIDIHPPAHVCVVSWDEHGTIDMGSTKDLEWLGLNKPPRLWKPP